MAKKRNSKKKAMNRKRILAALLFILSLLVLVSLITHSELDNSRITNEVESHLSPFEIHYHNQGGMMGAYLSIVLLYLIGWLAYFVPLGLALYGARLFSFDINQSFKVNTMLVFVISLFGTVLYNIHLLILPTLGSQMVAAGGYLTEKLTLLSLTILGETGSYIVIGGLIVILIMTYTSITPWLAGRISLPGKETFSGTWSWFAGLGSKLFSFSWLPSMPEFGRKNDDEEELSELKPRHSLPETVQTEDEGE